MLTDVVDCTEKSIFVLTQENVEEILNLPGFTILLFSAKPTRGQGPLLKTTNFDFVDLATWSKADFFAAWCDARQEEVLAKRFDISDLPTYLILYHGQVLAKKVGYQRPTLITEWLKEYLGSDISHEAEVARV